MALKDDLKAYQARWAELEAVVKDERRAASLEITKGGSKVAADPVSKPFLAE
jgi:hypothetical protein